MTIKLEYYVEMTVKEAEKNSNIQCSCTDFYEIYCKIMNHHHHHHVPEGLGVFPVP